MCREFLSIFFTENIWMDAWLSSSFCLVWIFSLEICAIFRSTNVGLNKFELCVASDNYVSTFDSYQFWFRILFCNSPVSGIWDVNKTADDIKLGFDYFLSFQNFILFVSRKVLAWQDWNNGVIRCVVPFQLRTDCRGSYPLSKIYEVHTVSNFSYPVKISS